MLKEQKKAIATLSGDMDLLKRHALDHYHDYKVVYTAVRTQAMYSEQKVPEDGIMAFPAFSEVLREAKLVTKPIEPAFDESDLDDSDKGG